MPAPHVPKLLLHCAEKLQSEQNPLAVVNYMAGKYPPSELATELSRVRHLWQELYGDTMKRNVSYIRDFKKVLKHVECMADDSRSERERTRWQEVREAVLDFHSMSFSQQYRIRSKARQSSEPYTGKESVDDMLCDLVRLPTYVKELQCSQHEQRPATHVKLIHNSDSSASLTAPPSKRCATSISSTPAPEHQNPVATRNISVEQRAHMDTKISEMLAILQYARPRYFDLVCALAFMCGRSMAEIAALGDFSADTKPMCKHSVTFKQSANSESITVPLLCDADVFLAALERLRAMKANIKSTSRLINNSFGKSANAAAKSLLGTACVFTDLRAIYAAYSYLLYSASDTSLQKWVRNVMQGGPHMLMTPAFLAKCQAAVAERARNGAMAFHGSRYLCNFFFWLSHTALAAGDATRHTD
jgi:Telomere resolvase